MSETDDVEIVEEEQVVEPEETEVEEKVSEESEKIELEPWMKTGEEEVEQTTDDPSKIVPVSKFVNVKKKLKGKISERDSEIERLRAENEALKKPRPLAQVLVRPKVGDFSNDDDFNTAMDDYYDQRTVQTVARTQKETSQTQAIVEAKTMVDTAVESHYERATSLIEKSGIKPELYQGADAKVRMAVESIQPGRGEAIVDQLISILGEGSEKVMYYLGVNETGLNKLTSLLSSDPSGMKATAFLGEQKQKLTNPNKPRSQAPAPASQINGDANGSPQGSALKRKYDAAHKKGDTQAAYNIKKEARANNVDVKKW